MKLIMVCLFLLGFMPVATTASVISTAANSITKTDFVMTKFFSTNGRSFNSFGQAEVSAKQGICWQVQKPIIRRWLITQQAVTEFGSNGEKKLIANSEDSLLSFMSTSFAALLAQNEESLGQDFSITSNPQKEEIYLRPKRDPLAKIIFSINISLSGSFVKRIKIIELNNSYTSLEFSNQRLISPNTPEDDFCNE